MMQYYVIVCKCNVDFLNVLDLIYENMEDYVKHTLMYYSEYYMSHLMQSYSKKMCKDPIPCSAFVLRM